MLGWEGRLELGEEGGGSKDPISYGVGVVLLGNGVLTLQMAFRAWGGGTGGARGWRVHEFGRMGHSVP